jgi:hypothetical protein
MDSHLKVLLAEASVAVTLPRRNHLLALFAALLARLLVLL